MLSKLNSRLIMLLPYFLVAVIFILVPMIFLFVKAVKPVNDTFNNFSLLESSNTWKILWRSILTGLVTAGICLLLGLPFAYWVARSNSSKFKLYALTFLVAPMAIFTLAKLLGIRSIFMFMFGEKDFFSTGYFVVIGLTYLDLPFMILPMYSVFNTMPKSIVEASEDLGYNKVKTLFYVIVPYGSKAIMSGLALVFMLAATSIAVSDKMLIDSLNFVMIANEINQHAHIQNPFELALTSSVSLVTTAIMMTITLFIIWIPRINSLFSNVKRIILNIKRINYKKLFKKIRIKGNKNGKSF